MTKPLMPKATAVWLVENTALTFKQIADFCELHTLEVQAIADNERGEDIVAESPLLNGQLTEEAIRNCEKDHNLPLLGQETSMKHLYISPNGAKKGKKASRYTPLVQRKDKPNSAFWIIQRYPEITDSTIAKLLGMTKKTVESIRSNSHWNSQNITPKDPVILDLCTQTELEKEIKKAYPDK